MHIAMISEHASPVATLGGCDAGGQNVYVAALATALAKRRHTVTVYTRKDNADAAPRQAFAPGVEVVNVPAGPEAAVPKDELLPYMADLAAGIAADWNLRSPDVIHAHFWMSGLAAHEARRLARVDAPVAQTFHALGVVKRRHQGAEDTSPAERVALEAELAARADVIAASCSDEAFELRSMGAPARRIAIVPCGVDTDLFSPQPAAPRATGEPFHLACVGRLVKRKGVDLVIDALAELAEQERDVDLTIIGGDGDAAQTAASADGHRLLAHAHNAGVSDRVKLVGSVAHPELTSRLASMDAVVCAPWYEPFGIVPLEAMALRKPVIAAQTGGLTDTVVHHETGLQIPPRDPHAIADAVATLADDDALRERLATNGRKRVVSRYTWSRIAELTERAYAQALSGVGTPATHLRATGSESS